MFTELLSYDPDTIDPAIREQMAAILKARSELLIVQSEISGLRSRVWSREEGLVDFIEFKAANLLKLREEHSERLLALLKASVNVEGLLELLPALAVALLQQLNIPLSVILEAVGMDLDEIKFLIDAAKKEIDNL